MLLPNYWKPLWCYIWVFRLQSLPLITPFVSQGFPTNELLQTTNLFPFHLFFTSFFFSRIKMVSLKPELWTVKLQMSLTPLDIVVAMNMSTVTILLYKYITCTLTRAKKERDRARVLVKRWTQSQSHDDFFPLPSSPSWSNKVSSSSSSRIIFAAAAAVVLFSGLSTVQAAFLLG